MVGIPPIDLWWLEWGMVQMTLQFTNMKDELLGKLRSRWIDRRCHGWCHAIDRQLIWMVLTGTWWLMFPSIGNSHPNCFRKFWYIKTGRSPDLGDENLAAALARWRGSMRRVHVRVHLDRRACGCQERQMFIHLDKFHYDLTATEAWESWLFFFGKSFPNGRTLEVSRLVNDCNLSRSMFRHYLVNDNYIEWWTIIICNR